MGRYVLRRVLSLAWVLFGVSLLAFGLVRLVPGDTATVLLGTRYTEEDAARLRERLGLDAPLPAQYATWIGGALKGDLGQSSTGRPVTAELRDALVVTFELAALALLLAMLLGLPLGAWAGIRVGQSADKVISTASLAGIAVPGFWLGTLLVLLFALALGVLPSGGFVRLGADPLENLRHMLLPAVALGLPVAAVLVRTTRAAVVQAQSLPHVRTARAKGLSGRAVLLHHVLRNAAPGVLAVTGVQAGWLLGGSAVIEALFSVPGLGRLALDALERRDYATLQGVILLAGGMFALVNLAVDVAHALTDPRVAEEVTAHA